MTEVTRRNGLLRFDPSFIRIGSCWINLKNVAYIETSDVIRNNEKPIPAIFVVFNTNRDDTQPLHLAFTGEDLKEAERTLGVLWRSPDGHQEP